MFQHADYVAQGTTVWRHRASHRLLVLLFKVGCKKIKQFKWWIVVTWLSLFQTDLRTVRKQIPEFYLRCRKKREVSDFTSDLFLSWLLAKRRFQIFIFYYDCVYLFILFSGVASCRHCSSVLWGETPSRYSVRKVKNESPKIKCAAETWGSINNNNNNEKALKCGSEFQNA